MHSDPGLSPRGLAQASQIAEGLHAIAQSSWHFLASPKQRARQTLLPLATRLGANLKISTDLDERTADESAEHFYSRVSAHIHWLGQSAQQKNQGLILVSHSDWIHEALVAIPSDTNLQNESYQWWSPAQFMHFHVRDELWHLEKFSHF